MDDDNRPLETFDDQGVSRRGFTALSAAVGVAAAATGASAQSMMMDVSIKTPDGTCDAALFHPTKGSAPAVLVWPDALGLRPEFRQMGQRLADAGYTVLVPNPFYRTRKAPVITGPFDFNNNADRAKLTELRSPLTNEALERDSKAFLAFLDSLPMVNKKAKAGVQGYCMGGPFTLLTAATVPDRVGAAASFHGGGLVSDQPSSPHLLAPRIKAECLFAIADNDDQRQPDAKDKLKAAFPTAKVEVYKGAQHGWCVPGSAVYNKDAAEKAWAELLALYKRKLV